MSDEVCCVNCGDVIVARMTYNGPGWTHTHHDGGQCRIYARAPDGTPFPPYYQQFVQPKEGTGE